MQTDPGRGGYPFLQQDFADGVLAFRIPCSSRVNIDSGIIPRRIFSGFRTLKALKTMIASLGVPMHQGNAAILPIPFNFFPKGFQAMMAGTCSPRSEEGGPVDVHIE